LLDHYFCENYNEKEVRRAQCAAVSRIAWLDAEHWRHVY